MPCIVEPITFFINKCIDVSIFPDKLKTAQVRPLFKKNNILEKGNYRPVSVCQRYQNLLKELFLTN